MFRYRIDADLELEMASYYHASELYACVWANKSHLTPYMGWVDWITQDESSIYGYIKRDLHGLANERRWACVIRYQGKLIGRMGLYHYAPHIREGELNYWLDQAYVGKGIMTRCLRVFLDFLFQDLQMHHIFIGVAVDNPPSIAVAERLGFQREFTARGGDDRPEDQFVDLHFYGMLRSEWQVTSTPAFRCELGDGFALVLSEPRQTAELYAVAMANEAHLKPWLRWINQNYSLDAEAKRVQEGLSAYAEGQGLFCTLMHETKVIGKLRALQHDRYGGMEIGYWMAQGVQGKGVMSRALNALLAEVFQVWGVHRVFIRAAVDNRPSRGVAERAGMTLEAILRQEGYLGASMDMAFYGLLQAEFRAKQATTS